MSQVPEISHEVSTDSPRSIRLDTVQSVRREMTGVYFKAKKSAGPEISVADAGKLTFILDRIRSCISESEVEERLAKIESALNAS